MAYKVIIPQDITNVGKEFLRQRGYEVAIGSNSRDPQVLRREIADADALLARTAPFPAEVLSGAPHLKAIGRHGVGVNNIDLQYCNEHDITVTYTPDANSDSVAEHTIGFLVAAAHNFSRFDRGVRAGEWEIRDQYRGVNLSGKTLGLVGLGRIGLRVAQKAKAAFDMRILAYDPFLPTDHFPEQIERVDDLVALMCESQFVSIHAPATERTIGMINRETIAKMQDGAFLVNCSRGEAVVLDDLYTALCSGKLRGAALDVYSPEPPDVSHPIFQLENVLFTPHAAAQTEEAMDMMGLHAAMGIHSVLSGEQPLWPVHI